MCRENSANFVFVQIDSKCGWKLLCNTSAPTPRIEAFEINDNSYDFRIWPFWSWFLFRLWSEEFPVLSFGEVLMDCEQSWRSKCDWDTREPTSPDKLAQCAKNEPLKVWEIWTSFYGAIEKENLLFENQIFSYHGLYSSRFNPSNDDIEQIKW